MRSALKVLLGVLAGASAPGALAAPPAKAAGLSWEGAFGARATRPGVQLRAKLEDEAGGAHALELWREGEKRLRRRTDGVVEIAVEDVGPAGAPAYAFTVADLRDHTVRRLTPEDARRVGSVYTWWPLAHLLGPPAPRYTLQRSPEPGLKVGPARCDWYRYTPEGLPEERICWSREFAVALRVERKQGAGWRARLTVESLAALAPGDAGLKFDTAGLREMALPEPDDD